MVRSRPNGGGCVRRHAVVIPVVILGAARKPAQGAGRVVIGVVAKALPATFKRASSDAAMAQIRNIFVMASLRD